MQKVASYILLNSYYEVYDTSMTKKARQVADFQYLSTFKGRRGIPF